MDKQIQTNNQIIYKDTHILPSGEVMGPGAEEAKSYVRRPNEDDDGIRTEGGVTSSSATEWVDIDDANTEGEAQHNIGTGGYEVPSVDARDLDLLISHAVISCTYTEQVSVTPLLLSRDEADLIRWLRVKNGNVTGVLPESRESRDTQYVTICTLR